MAARLRVHENTLGKWERGETVPSALQLVLIARLTETGIATLLGGSPVPPARVLNEPPRHSTVAVPVGELMFVPLFDERSAAAGEGSFDAVDRVLSMRCFETEYIRRDLGISHNQVALITVVGSDAEPQVRSGDTVLVDRLDTDVTFEGLHLVRIDHALMIKLLQRRPGCIMVSSNNEAYAPFAVQLNGGTDFEVLGRCRWAGVTLR